MKGDEHLSKLRFKQQTEHVKLSLPHKYSVIKIILVLFFIAISLFMAMPPSDVQIPIRLTNAARIILAAVITVLSILLHYYHRQKQIEALPILWSEEEED